MGRALGFDGRDRAKGGVVQNLQISPNRAWCVIRIYGCLGSAFLRCRVLFVCISLDKAGIRRKAQAAQQTLCNAAFHGCFKQVTPQITVASLSRNRPCIARQAVCKANLPRGSILGEGGVILPSISQIKATEPAIGKVQMPLFAETPFRRIPR